MTTPPFNDRSEGRDMRLVVVLETNVDAEDLRWNAPGSSASKGILKWPDRAGSF
jgi:hypothetical protein